MIHQPSEEFDQAAQSMEKSSSVTHVDKPKDFRVANDELEDPEWHLDYKIILTFVVNN